MSYEIKVMEDILRMIAPKLKEYDIEIVAGYVQHINTFEPLD